MATTPHAREPPPPAAWPPSGGSWAAASAHMPQAVVRRPLADDLPERAAKIPELVNWSVRRGLTSLVPNSKSNSFIGFEIELEST